MHRYSLWKERLLSSDEQPDEEVSQLLEVREQEVHTREADGTVQNSSNGAI